QMSLVSALVGGKAADQCGGRKIFGGTISLQTSQQDATDISSIETKRDMMSSQTLPFYDRVESALHDQTLQTALGRATTRFMANRAHALEALNDADGLRDQARAIRAKALSRLDELLERLADQVEARGGQVCWAEDGAAACRYIANLAH